VQCVISLIKMQKASQSSLALLHTDPLMLQNHARKHLRIATNPEICSSTHRQL